MKIFSKIRVFVASFLCMFCTLNICGQEESTRAEVFNYEIGDIFHTYGYYYLGDYLQYQEYRTYYILDKYYSQTGDTLFYEQEIYWEYYVVIWDTTYYGNDTETFYINNLDSLILNGNADSVYSDPLLYNGRLVNSVIFMSPPPEFEYGENLSWIEGCGGPFGFQQYDFYTQVEGVDLVYFKKGNEEWGTPHFVSAPEKSGGDIPVKIFPNPSSEYFIIEMTESILKNCSFTILSYSGKCLKTYLLETGQNQINISDLPQGLYLIRINTGTNLHTRKFLKN